MAKILTYVFITVGLMVLFNFAGLVDGGLIGQFKLNTIEGISSFQDYGFFDWFKDAWTSVIAAIGITIGTIIATRDFKTALSAGIASGILVAFIGDLVTIAVRLNADGNIIAALSILIFAPLVMGYIVSLWEWVVGMN